MNRSRVRVRVLRVQIDAIMWDEVLHVLHDWGDAHESRYVCLCNVHSVVTASRNPAFLDVLENADMATPDGAPVAWAMRTQGAASQQRINGPDLMWHYCQRAEASGQPVYLYGNTDQTLSALNSRLKLSFPKLNIAGMYSPPFRQLTAQESDEVVERINASGAGVVFVSLGCPKQEIWMAAQRGRINAVMIGVGAAFDYHAGTIRRAPKWMQGCGLEWLHRLVSEPRRLWRRYLVTNSIFIAMSAKQLIFEKRKRD